MAEAQQKSESVMDYAPGWTQISVLIFVVMGGGVLASLSAMDLVGTVVLFLLLSPIILPVGAVIALSAAAFMAAVSIGVAALVWVYRYERVKPSVGSEKIDRARVRLLEAAEKLKAQLQYKLSNE